MSASLSFCLCLSGSITWLWRLNREKSPPLSFGSALGALVGGLEGRLVCVVGGWLDVGNVGISFVCVSACLSAFCLEYIKEYIKCGKFGG